MLRLANLNLRGVATKLLVSIKFPSLRLAEDALADRERSEMLNKSGCLPTGEPSR